MHTATPMRCAAAAGASGGRFPPAPARFLAWNGKVWEITATHYLTALQTHHRKHGCAAPARWLMYM